MARCAASASRPDHRATQAARAAARSGSGTSKARCPASKRSQGGCFSAKTTADFDTDNNQAAATGAHASRGIARVRRQLGQGARPLPAEPHGADDGGIHGLLRAMPKGQSVRDDLDAAVVGHRHVDVSCLPGGHDGRHAHRLLGTPAQQRVQEGGPGRRALRKLRRQPCDRRVGQGDHGRRTYAGRPAVASGAGAAATRGTMAKSPSIQPRWGKRRRPVQHAAQPVTAAALEMRHQGE